MQGASGVARCILRISTHISINILTVRVNKLASATVVTLAMVDAAFGATAVQTKPQDTDPFRKGDYVVYPAHGVGKVDRVGSEEIAGHRLNLIQISFAENRMTLRVPV